MTTCGLLALVREAEEQHRAVGAFNVITLEHAEAIVAAAEQVAVPVILQVSANTVAYHGGLGGIGSACTHLAAHACTPVAVHLDHAKTFSLCEEAMSLGFGSVMFDASMLAFEENAAQTRAVVAWAHSAGIAVEAELGVVGGKHGDPDAAPLTDPAAAAAFVARTGVDLLAVAVGTSHQMENQDARLDLGLIRELHASVPVPLVLHGSSGVHDRDLAAAIGAGIAKVNIATFTNRAFTAGMQGAIGAARDPRTYLGPGRERMTEAVAQKLRVISLLGEGGSSPLGATSGVYASP